jgi:hypothetical protein
LEIEGIFKDEDREEGDGVMDLILVVVELLRRDIDGLARVVREALELVKLWDKG